jgi:hypothetical protein
MYTVHQSSDRMWHVLKDGRIFTISHSKLTAEHIASSLNEAKTPTPAFYMASQVLDEKPALSWFRRRE